MLERPTAEEIRAAAERFGWFSLDDSEVAAYTELSDLVLAVIDGVADDLELAPTVPDRPYRRPTGEEDPYNAIVHWCDVQATASGLLDGVRVAIKDSVSVAGIPMTLGSPVVRDFAPSDDAVVTSRLLAAGACIVATANMDSFAFTGGGDSSATGPIRNPFDETRSPGGSSGGSAAAVYYPGVVDVAIGCDQGGSIRLPSAWCGLVGLKPTHGLVPYSGIVGIDQTFDHAGPMARTALDVARVLAVIAGPDAGDPRQALTPPFDGRSLLDAVADAPADLAGLRIGVLVEGFGEGTPEEDATSRSVRDVAARMAAAGAELVDVSVPEHAAAGGIAFAGFIEGMAASLYGGGNGFHWKGRYWPELALMLADRLQRYGADLPPQIKLVTLLGDHLQRGWGGAVYAAAQNRRPGLTAAIDRGLDGVDALLLPTAPFTAYEHDDDLGTVDRVMRGWAPLGNCAPTDMSGHPAISLPASSIDGLPVGSMLIGRRFADRQLVEIAARYERAAGWDPVVVERQQRRTGPATPPVAGAGAEQNL